MTYDVIIAYFSIKSKIRRGKEAGLILWGRILCYNTDMAIERLVEPTLNEDNAEEEKIEISLRPTTFVEYIGQEHLKNNIKLAIDAVKKRNDGTTLDHVLLYGPPGLGKTTMAGVIAHEMGASLRVTSGPAIERAGDLASILTNLKDGDVLFIDEIHRLPRVVEEMLYSAMEDYQVDIIVGQDEGAHPVHFPLPPFTLIGATTRPGALSSPLRHRFGIVQHLRYYTVDELATIVERTARLFEVPIKDQAAKEIGMRSRGTPRIANRLLKRVRDFAQVYHEDGLIDDPITDKALSILKVDQAGLDETDRKILEVIIRYYGGGPVGLSTIAANISEETTTIEDMYEPFLIQNGFLQRTPRGRLATPKAYDHLGIPYAEEF